MAVANVLVALLVSLVIGGLALFIAGEIVHGESDLSHGVVTALIGAIVWALLAWIPLVGVLLALVGWVAVINFRYPGGWGRAVVHGVVAWIVAVVILLVLGAVGFPVIDALGVPAA